MKLREAISFNLKRIRSELGLNQDQFAELCGLSVSAIQNYEAKTREPKEDARARMTSALGVSELEFYKLPDNAEATPRQQELSFRTAMKVLEKHSALIEMLAMLPEDSDLFEMFYDSLEAEIENLAKSGEKAKPA